MASVPWPKPWEKGDLENRKIKMTKGDFRDLFDEYSSVTEPADTRGASTRNLIDSMRFAQNTARGIDGYGRLLPPFDAAQTVEIGEDGRIVALDAEGFLVSIIPVESAYLLQQAGLTCCKEVIDQINNWLRTQRYVRPGVYTKMSL